MLVLHSSSVCDVCLDPYDLLSEPPNPPYAIACGHIFCLTCLRSLSPSSCPLCRKLFLPERVKKLHIAVPSSLDLSEEHREAHAGILLQRIVLISGDNVPEGEVIESVTEAQEWLATQPQDATSSKALRSAIDTLHRHKALQDQSERDKQEFRLLRHQFRASRRNAHNDLQTSRAVEDNLLARIQEIEDEHATKLALSQAEVARLQKELSRFQNVSNPLPPPPAPLPLDRLPPFARPGASTETDPLLAASSSYRFFNMQKVQGKQALKDGAGGSAAAFYRDLSPHPSWQSNHADLASPSVPERRRSQTHLASEVHVVGGPDESRNERYQYQHYSDSVTGSIARSDHALRERVHMISGVTPTRRIIPPLPPSSPEWSRSDTEAIDHGRKRREQGYYPHPEYYSRAEGLPRRALGRDSEEAVNEVQTRLASASAYLQGYGSGYDSGYHLATDQDTHILPDQDGYFSEPSPLSPRERHTGRFGSSGALIGSSMVEYPAIHEADPATPTHRPDGSTRRHTTVPPDPHRPSLPLRPTSLYDVLQGSSPGPSFRLMADHATNFSDGRRAGTGSSSMDGRSTNAVALMQDMSSPSSATSWGTVYTSSRSSIGDLGLVGLQHGGVRGTGSVAGDSLIGREDGQMEEAEEREGEGDVLGADNEVGTPMMESRRSLPSSSSFDSVDGPLNSGNSFGEAMRQGFYSSGDQHATQGTGEAVNSIVENALALSFDASLSLHGEQARPRSLQVGRQQHEIHAPTPVVGARRLLNAWSHRARLN